jgi:hypothetical protein
VDAESEPLELAVRTSGRLSSVRPRDTGGMFARIWRDASDDERETIKTRLVEAFAAFTADGGYELPGVAVVALAS